MIVEVLRRVNLFPASQRERAGASSLTDFTGRCRLSGLNSERYRCVSLRAAERRNDLDLTGSEELERERESQPSALTPLKHAAAPVSAGV